MIYLILKKYLLPVVIVLLIIISLLIKVFFSGSKLINEQKACTEEAMKCSDGSAVVRTGPNCDFAPCPSVSKLNEIKYFCDDEKRINAVFDNKSSSVDLNLSDGRVFVLPNAISASGARYATPDESVVFWNKSETAFIEENGIISYKNCIEKES